MGETETLWARFSRSRRVPLTYANHDLYREQFQTLAEKWKMETEFASSPAQIASHPAHRAIVGLGWAAVPLILEDLAETGGLWFLALREITGENPVPHYDRGFVDKMTSAWLDWGREKGFLLEDGRNAGGFRKAG